VRVIPLHGSQPVGEASDATMLGMDGFVPPDGVPLEDFTFGDGGLGFVETFEYGDAANDVYTVDAKTGYFRAPLLVGGNGFYYGLEGTVFAKNLQVVSAWNYIEGVIGGNLQAFPPQYALLNPAIAARPNEPQWGSGYATNQWFGLPFPGSAENKDLAYNRTGNLALFDFEPLSNTSAPSLYLSTAKLPEGQALNFPPSENPIGLTFGPAYNVTTAYTVPEGSSAAFIYGGISLDPALNIGIAEVGESNPCGKGTPSQVSTISLANGAITTFAGGGSDGIFETTYDPGTHILAADDPCGDLILTNVVTKATTVVNVPLGQTPFFISADTKQHLILLGEGLDPTFLSNNDAGSAVGIYDEGGHLLKTVRGFEFYADNLPGNLELDQTDRMMFLPELTGTMIEPASY
jgi:hypothetical protein